jgi:uncharacterized phage-associated protein
MTALLRRVGEALSGKKPRPSAPVSADDVAAYILQKCGSMTTMKLQKLVYYAQAWSLVWDEQPLFTEKIEAWANGPVVRELYDRHRGQFRVSKWTAGDPTRLTSCQKETIDAVLHFYGDKSSQWLSNLTHKEDPWQNARLGLGPGQRGEAEIQLDSLAEYYSSLV